MGIDLDEFLEAPIHEQVLAGMPSNPSAAYRPTNRNIKACPCCVPQQMLELRKIESGEERLKCDNCNWIYY